MPWVRFHQLCPACQKRHRKSGGKVGRPSTTDRAEVKRLHHAGMQSPEGQTRQNSIWGPIAEVVGDFSEGAIAFTKYRAGNRRWKVWTGRYHGYEPFCTLRCALAYARAAWRHRSKR